MTDTRKTIPITIPTNNDQVVPSASRSFTLTTTTHTKRVLSRTPSNHTITTEEKTETTQTISYSTTDPAIRAVPKSEELPRRTAPSRVNKPQRQPSTITELPAEATESTPLLPQQPAKADRPGIFRKMGNGLKAIGQYIYHHPITAIFAVVSAAPSGINAGLAATHTKAQDISADWFKKLSGPDKALTLGMFSASLVINMILAALFIPQVSSLFKAEGWRQHPFRQVMVVLLGSLAAISLFAISIDSFAFLLPLGVAMATASFAINFPTRAVSINRALERMGKAVHKTPIEDLSQLSKLKKKHVQNINRRLAEAAERQDKSDPVAFNQAMISVIDDYIVAIDANKSLKPKSCSCRGTCGCFGKVLGQSIDYLAAATVLTVSLAMFSQKGIDGFKKIESWTVTEPEFSYIGQLPDWLQLGVGAVSGIGSAALYALSTFDFRQTATDIVTTIAKERSFSQALTALVLTTMAALSGPSMVTVVNNIQDNPNTNPLIQNFFENMPAASILAAAGVVMVNLKSALAQLMPHRYVEMDRPTLASVQTFFRQNPQAAEQLQRNQQALQRLKNDGQGADNDDDFAHGPLNLNV